MSLDASLAERLNKSRELVQQLKAVEADVFSILHESEVGCSTDNGCDLFDLENRLLHESALFQLRIIAYRAERLRILAYIARENVGPLQKRSTIDPRLRITPAYAD